MRYVIYTKKDEDTLLCSISEDTSKLPGYPLGIDYTDCNNAHIIKWTAHILMVFNFSHNTAFKTIEILFIN